MPVRIYDIAKKLGIESKEVLAKAKELGIAAKVPSSSLDKITGEYLGTAIGRQPAAQPAVRRPRQPLPPAADSSPSPRRRRRPSLKSRLLRQRRARARPAAPVSEWPEPAEPLPVRWRSPASPPPAPPAARFLPRRPLRRRSVIPAAPVAPMPAARRRRLVIRAAPFLLPVVVPPPAPNRPRRLPFLHRLHPSQAGRQSWVHATASQTRPALRRRKVLPGAPASSSGRADFRGRGDIRSVRGGGPLGTAAHAAQGQRAAAEAAGQSGRARPVGQAAGQNRGAGHGRTDHAQAAHHRPRPGRTPQTQAVPDH